MAALTYDARSDRQHVSVRGPANRAASEKEADAMAVDLQDNGPATSYGAVALCRQTTRAHDPPPPSQRCPSCAPSLSHRRGRTTALDGSRADAWLAPVGHGEPAPGVLRKSFENRFAVNLTDVRLHDGAHSAARAAAVGARAFTIGNDVSFGRGAYAPHSADGRRLIAHELAHVVQQRSHGGVVQLQADDAAPSSAVGIIAAFTNGLDLREDDLGSFLATLAMVPMFTPLVRDVIASVDYFNRDEVALALVRRLTDAQLEAWAAGAGTRALVERLRDDMAGGISFPDERTQVQRIDEVLSRVSVMAPGTPQNPVAAEVVARYEAAPPAEKFPGGLCYEVTRDRIEAATEEVRGEELTAELPEREPSDQMDPSLIFDRLWGSLISPRRSWLTLPEAYRGNGAPGAMTYAGKARIVDQAEIWRGDLRPGAVIQTWRLASDFDRVSDGLAPERYGHSFIFHEYVRDDAGEITGMRIMDQGFQGDIELTEADYGYWVGANLTL